MWVEIRTGRSPSTCRYGQNSLGLGKINLLPVKNRRAVRTKSGLKTPSSYPPSSTSSPKQCRGTGAAVSLQCFLSTAPSSSRSSPAPCRVPPTACCPSRTDPTWALCGLQPPSGHILLLPPGPLQGLQGNSAPPPGALARPPSPTSVCARGRGRGADLTWEEKGKWRLRRGSHPFPRPCRVGQVWAS